MNLFSSQAPLDRKVPATAGSLSDPQGAKTEHGSGKDTATPGSGGFEAQPRAAWRARTRRPTSSPYYHITQLFTV
jgi:hypothetical protein